MMKLTGRKLLSSLLALVLLFSLVPGVNGAAMAAPPGGGGPGGTGTDIGGGIVIGIAVHDVTLPSEITVTAGEAYQLTFEIMPSDATDKTVRWSVTEGSDKVALYKDSGCSEAISANETFDAATQNSIYVYGISAGTATVTVTSAADSSKSASCAVTVNAADSGIEGVTLPSELTVTAGETSASSLNFDIMPPEATDRGVRLSVTEGSDKIALYKDPGCASQISAGETFDAPAQVFVKGISAGTATVTATSAADDTKSASCTVTVNAAPTPSITLAQGLTANGTAQQLITAAENVTFLAVTDTADDYMRTWVSVNEYELATNSELKRTEAGTYYVYYWTDSMPPSMSDAGELFGTVSIAAGTVAVESLDFDEHSTELTVDEVQALTATVEPDNATDKTVCWSVDNSDCVKLYTDLACTDEVGTEAIEALTVYVKAIAAGTATVTVTSAADSSKSAYCDVTVNEAAHTHGGITFIAWESTSSLPNEAGSYYLTGDVTLGDTWYVPSGTTNLCLNGKEVNVRTAPGGAILAGKSIVNVPSGAILNLYDEAGNNGKLAKAYNASQHKDKTGGGVYIDGTLNMYGGKICDNEMIFDNYGAGVYVSGTGTFNMFGGEISNNSAGEDCNGGGVYVAGNGTFTMSGGEISNNRAGDSADDDSYGGGVYVATNGTFTMSGGTICNNSTGNAGGGVYVYTNGTFTMSGGTIRDNTAIGDGGGVDNYAGHFAMSGGTITGNTVTSGNGGGIIVEGNGVTCSLSGSADISGNHKGSDDNNIYLQSGRKIKVDGPLTNTKPIGVTMQAPGVFTTGSTDTLKASDYLDKFVSDDSACAVQTSGNELTLKMDGDRIEVPYLYYENDAAAIAGTPTTGTQECMQVESSDSAVVWSDDWYVVNEDAVIDVANTRIEVNGEVNLILMDGKKLTANQGIHVGPGATLNIYAQSMGDEAGVLEAIGFSAGAGIGGAVREVGGTITIHGGTVTATGGNQGGAGIGGGGSDGGAGGTITIHGGTVNATGGQRGGAGIGGGGDQGAGGDITINGGTVNATGGQRGAGIGGGGYNGAGGTITISSGTVKASGGQYGAGIGGGNQGAGGDITINGGTVNATGGQRGAGIGGGYGGAGGDVTISGGTVNATGGQRGAGIGGGYRGGGGTVTISGGTVKSYDEYAAGIGAGTGAIDQGMVTLGAGAVVKAGDNNDWDNLPEVTDYTTNHSQHGAYIISKIAVTGVTLQQGESDVTALTLDKGESVTLTAVVAPENAADKTVKWSVGGTNADAVKLYTDEDCTIEVGTEATSTLTVYAKGLSAGEAAVTATSNADDTKSASCAVTVNAAPHTHAFSYSASGDTVTATCTEGCDITEGLTLTISAPAAPLIYDGTTTYPATLSTDYNTEAFPGPYTIIYTKDGATFDGTPTDAGTYTASVTVEGQTAQVNYEIAKATPAVGNFAYTAPSSLTYDGNEKTATVILAQGITGMGEVSVKHYRDAACTTEVDNPTDVGTYYVGITVTEGDNYNAVTSVLYDSNWKFTIAKATPTADNFDYNAPSSLGYDGNAKSASVIANSDATGMGQVTVKYYSDAACTTEVDNPTDVGTYYVGITLTEGTNYSATSAVLHDASWTFTIGKATPTTDNFSVTVTSSGNGTTTGATVSPVTGGGTFAFNTTHTVTAKAVNGYVFLGWYKVGAEVNAENKLSSDLSYDYTVGTENALVAVFSPVAGGTFRLTVTGSRFKINDGTVQRQRFDDLYNANAGITLTFVGTADETFLYWVNAAGKILSTSATYNFDLVMNTEVQAVTSDAQAGHEALVAFVSSPNNGQVLSQRYYSDTDTIVFPAAPSSMGKTFTGWNMTEEEIRASIATSTRIVVYPVYTSNGNEYVVTIKYQYDNTVIASETTEPKAVGEGQIVTVPETYDNHTFVKWTDEAGNVLGTTTTYGVRPTGNITLIAVYGDSAGEQIPVVFMTNMFASQSSGTNRVNYTATRSIPEGYTIERAGILYTRVEYFGSVNDLAALTQALKTALTFEGKTANVLEARFTSTLLNDTGTLYHTSSVADRLFVGRAYVIVKDANGQITTYYSDNAVYGSYSGLATGFGTISFS